MKLKNILIRLYLIIWIIFLVVGYIVLIIPGPIFWVLTGGDLWDKYTDLMMKTYLDTDKF